MTSSWSSSAIDPSDISDPPKERGDSGVGIGLSSLTAIVRAKASHSNLDILGAGTKVPFAINLPVEGSTTVTIADTCALGRFNANILRDNLEEK